MNAGFDNWFAKYFPRDGDRHGIYNGMNLVGIDIGRFYQELGKNPNLTIPQFLKEETVWYRVVVPASNKMDILSRYPWLSNGQTTAAAWEISFARSGVPLQIKPAETQLKEPTVVWVESSPFSQSLMTKGFIQGSGSYYFDSGLEADGQTRVVALPGATFNLTDSLPLLKDKLVVLLPDLDDAGIAALRKKP
jgi:hypothetical protein